MTAIAVGQHRANSLDSRGFFPIRISVLRLDVATGFDLYFLADKQRSFVLYRSHNLPFTEATRCRLVENSVTEVFARNDQRSLYNKYIEANIASIMADPNTPPTEKAGVIYSTGQSLVKDLLEDPRAGDLMARSHSLVENTAGFLFADRANFGHLLKVSSFDYYTYTHSVNVFVFTVSLANWMGYDIETAQIIGNGALLHDLGKSRIDPTIVNCPGKLSKEQWDSMKCHPMYGYELLLEQGCTNKIVLDMALSHHEKLNGKGYPEGLANGQIERHVRIATVSDIFDALTTRRSYKAAMGSFPALRLMRDEMQDELDQEIMRAFVFMMSGATAKN